MAKKEDVKRKMLKDNAESQRKNLSGKDIHKVDKMLISGNLKAEEIAEILTANPDYADVLAEKYTDIMPADYKAKHPEIYNEDAEEAKPEAEAEVKVEATPEAEQKAKDDALNADLNARLAQEIGKANATGEAPKTTETTSEFSKDATDATTETNEEDSKTLFTPEEWKSLQEKAELATPWEDPDGGSDDSPYPKKPAGKSVSWAKVAISEKEIDGTKYKVFRKFEADGTQAIGVRAVKFVKSLTPEGKAEVAKIKEGVKEAEQNVLKAAREGTQANFVLLRDYVTKHSFGGPVICANEPKPEIAVKTVKKVTDGAPEQTFRTVSLRFKNPGKILYKIYFVPERAYGLIKNNTVPSTEEELNEILTEEKPKLISITVKNDELLSMHVNVFNDYVREVDDLFDPDNSKFDKIENIKHSKQSLVGKFAVYPDIDKRKVEKDQTKVLEKRENETEEAFKKRADKLSARKAAWLKLQSEGSVEVLVSSMTVFSTQGPRLINSINFIPMKTFSSQPIGKLVKEETALDLNSIYLAKLNKANAFEVAPDARALIDFNQNQEIIQSIYFPFEKSKQRPELLHANGYFKTRLGDKIVKQSVDVSSVIRKQKTETKNGSERIVNVSHGFDDIQYNQSYLLGVQTACNKFLTKTMGYNAENLPKFPELKELALLTARTSNHKNTAKKSDKFIGQNIAATIAAISGAGKLGEEYIRKSFSMDAEINYTKDRKSKRTESLSTIKAENVTKITL